MKILVVDYYKKTADKIKRGLEESEYSVAVVHDGVNGLVQALTDMYSLVILDANLPKKDGITVIKELREAGISVPILILTDRATTENIVCGLDAGADDYLTKPFVFGELLARVRALLRRTKQERGAGIHFADLKMDPVAHKVWRNGKEIEMSSKEYCLLEYMMLNPNTVLSRAMIAEHVWGNKFENTTNIIDVYINYLRKKVDLNQPRKLINTVRKIGYIFCDK